MPVTPDRCRWLLLIHQLPKEPAYLRVKVGRRLARVGAIALKNSVYVLPLNDATAEDFQWVRRDIVEGGGDATVVEAHLVQGLSDEELEGKFREAKDAEYGEIVGHVRALSPRARTRRRRAPSNEERAAALAEIARLERRVEDVAATDFFGAAGRLVVTGLLAERKRELEPKTSDHEPTPAPPAPRGRTWVTRTGIHVDRIASAWLIRRFIDPEARFEFVPAKGHRHRAGELRFDMFEAEYSHEGDDCTFETLVRRFGIAEPGVRAISEIVHDIDIKDAKFGRPETAGFSSCIVGICRGTRDDEERLARGAVLLDAMLAHFSAGEARP